MPYVYGPKGEIYNFTDEEIKAKLKGGGWWAVPEGSKVNIIDNMGTRRGIDFNPQALINALQPGSELETEQAGKDRWAKKEFGDGVHNKVVNFGMGALRAATGGLSDIVASETGLMNPAELRMREEHGKASSFMGEMAGFIVGGKGALAKTPKGGFAKAMRATAPNVAIRAGNKVRKGLEKTMQSKGFSEGMTNMLSRTAGLAVEGGVIGAGIGVSQIAREEIPLWSAEAAGTIGLNALVGGGFGAAIPVAGKVIGAPFRAAGKGLKKLKPKAPKLSKDNPYKVGGPDAAKPEPGMLTKFTATTSGKNADDGAMLLEGPDSRFAREAVVQYEPIVAESTEAMQRAAQKKDILFKEQITDLWERGAKDDIMKGMASAPDKAGLKPRLQSFVSGASTTVEEISAELRSVGIPTGNIDKFKKLAARLWSTTEDMTDDQLAAAVDGLRKDLGVTIRSASTKFGPQQNTMMQLRTLYDDFAKILRDESILGEYGAAMGEIQPMYESLLFRRGAKLNYEIKMVGGNENWERIYEANPAKIEAFAKSVGTKAAEFDQQVLRETIPQEILMAKAFRRRFPKHVSQQTVDIIEKNGNDFLQHMKRMEKVNVVKGAHERWAGAGSLPSTMSAPAFGYLIGHTVGGFVTGMAGSMLGTLTTPQARIAMKSISDRFFNKLGAQSVVGKGIQGVRQQSRRKLSGAIKSLVGGAGPRVIAPAAVYGYDFEAGKQIKVTSANKSDVFRKTSDQVRQLQEPGMIQQQVEKNMSGLASEFPEMAFGLSMKMSQAINYLASTIPSATGGSMVDVIRGTRPQIPTAEMDKWLNRLQVVNNPSSVIEKAKQGILSSEEKEAAMAVYPELLQMWREAIVSAIRDSKTAPNYSALLQMGNLVGMDLVPGASGQAVQFYSETLIPATDNIPKSKQTMDTGSLSRSKLSEVESSRMTNFEQNQLAQK